jgi:hypothetical protein
MRPSDIVDKTATRSEPGYEHGGLLTDVRIERKRSSNLGLHGKCGESLAEQAEEVTVVKSKGSSTRANGSPIDETEPLFGPEGDGVDLVPLESLGGRENDTLARTFTRRV